MYSSTQEFVNQNTKMVKGTSGIKSILKWFYQDFTSIGGISQSRSTNLNWMRVFWLILFVAGAVFTILNIHDVVVQYFARNVVTGTQIIAQDKMNFPAITICPESGVHCQHLQERIQFCMNGAVQKTLKLLY